MARGKKKEVALSPAERLQAALVPDWEQPYQVPENWCWTTLKFISSHISDGSHNPPPNAGRGIPILSATNIHDHIIDMENATRWVTEEQWNIENQRTQIEPNDVLLTIVASIGRTAVVHDEIFALQRSVAVIKPKINADFLSYYFETPYIQNFMIDNAKGTAQKGFYLKSLGDMLCCLPPAGEQQRVVNRIESLFAKLDKAKQKAQDALDSFETRKAAILHKAFTGELTAQWRKEYGVGMENWQTRELVQCFEIVSGIQKTPARSPKDNPIPYLTVANVYRNRIDLSEIRYFEVSPEELDKLQLKNKDLLIVEGNGSGNEIGRCAMWHNELPVCVHQNHIIRLRSKTSDILPEFVLYYLNSETGKSVMQERAKTTAGLFNLSAGKVKTISFPFIPLDEQTEIVRILDGLLSKEQQAKEATEKVLEQIYLTKKAILTRAFRGELGTNDPSEESAVELLKKLIKE